MSKTRMTVGQAIVKFLNQQYIEMDGKEEPFVDGMFTIWAWRTPPSATQSSITAARSSPALHPSALAQRIW